MSHGLQYFGMTVTVSLSESTYEKLMAYRGSSELTEDGVIAELLELAYDSDDGELEWGDSSASGSTAGKIWKQVCVRPLKKEWRNLEIHLSKYRVIISLISPPHSLIL